MCATVFYTKLTKGRVYPKAARTGPYAFAQEVSRVRGKAFTRYVGIVRIPVEICLIQTNLFYMIVETLRLRPCICGRISRSADDS